MFTFTFGGFEKQKEVATAYPNQKNQALYWILHIIPQPNEIHQFGK
jgi:hypothetical protein